MRILHVADKYGGGLRITVDELSKELLMLDKIERATILICSTIEHIDASASGPIRIDYHSLAEGDKGVRKKAEFVAGFLSQIKGDDIVCIHAPSTLLGMVAAAYCIVRRVPYVTFYHGAKRKSRWDNLRRLFCCLICRIGAKKSIVVSRSGAFFTGGKSTVLPPPVTMEAEEHKTARPGAEQIILYPARFVPYKGQHDLVKMELYLRESDLEVDHKIVLCGNPEHRGYYDFVQREIADHDLADRIETVGFVEYEQMQTLYRQAKLVIFPTYEEGFGRIIVEAGVFGVPTIAYDTGGVGEVIIDNETGMLCETGDVEALARNMVRLLGDERLRREMGDKAMRVYRANYRSDIVANRFYESIVA